MTIQTALILFLILFSCHENRNEVITGEKKIVLTDETLYNNKSVHKTKDQDSSSLTGKTAGTGDHQDNKEKSNKQSAELSLASENEVFQKGDPGNKESDQFLTTINSNSGDNFSEKSENDEDPVKIISKYKTKEIKDRQDSDKELSFQDEHKAWQLLLQKHVSKNGAVNYKSFLNDKKQLDQYIIALKTLNPDKSWKKEQEMAYWINLYNAFTIQLILDEYPLKSIMDLDNGKVWDTKKIKIAGTSYTLNDIEHKMLRAKFKDARIHFAVNCAATSCPPLWNNAWTAENLESSLDKLTRKFVNNELYNTIENGKASLSRIFDWYKDDFGNVIEFINRYSQSKLKKGAKISYRDYDWSLNSI